MVLYVHIIVDLILFLPTQFIIKWEVGMLGSFFMVSELVIEDPSQNNNRQTSEIKKN